MVFTTPVFYFFLKWRRELEIFKRKEPHLILVPDLHHPYFPKRREHSSCNIKYLSILNYEVLVLNSSCSTHCYSSDSRLSWCIITQYLPKGLDIFKLSKCVRSLMSNIRYATQIHSLSLLSSWKHKHKGLARIGIGLQLSSF